MEQRKTLQELTLLDRFLFNETMEKPENMQAVLEIILGKEIILKYLPQSEREQRTSPIFRSVRLDVWTQDEDNTIYELEAQRKNTGNLPKRSRYYQSLIDSKILEPGTDDFNELHPVFVIIIMPFDLFKKNKYRYTFTMKCKEAEGVDLNDGAVRIFLNTHGKDDEGISPELKELLYFMEHTNEQKKVFQSDKVNMIRKSVRTIQNNAEVGVRYMQAWEEKLMFEREIKQEVLKQLQPQIDAAERKKKEAERKTEEAERKQSEAECKQSEAERKQSEAERKQSEAERKQSEAERKQEEAEQEMNRLKKESMEKELQILLNLFRRGFSAEEARRITNSEDAIVREALERFETGKL